MRRDCLSISIVVDSPWSRPFHIMQEFRNALGCIMAILHYGSRPTRDTRRTGTENGIVTRRHHEKWK